jgi:NAD(P)H-hydrate epimerase
MKRIDKKHIQSLYKTRNKDSHKGDFGHALIVAGSMGMTGAAVICTKACLRSGAGLVTVQVPETEQSILQIGIPEAMVQIRSREITGINKYAAIGIGPGIGTDAGTGDLLKCIFKQKKAPLVLDADALNWISKNPGYLKKIAAQTILTPHIKEFDRLFGHQPTMEKRIATAKEKAKELNIIIVLKQHKTLVFTPTEIFENSTGNAGLAKGGSGDALTGMICAFLSQGYTPEAAAKLGVYLHGLAADLALESQSMESLLISDVIDCIGRAFKTLI